MENENQFPPAPPRWAENFLRWYCAPHLLEEVAGDLQEEFYFNVKRFGKAKARREYILDVIRFIKPFAIKRRSSKPSNPTTGMIHHYTSIALRNLSRHKVFSAINITGLSLGLACCVLILLYTKDEVSYDRFHSNIDNIYQLTCTRIEKDGKEEKFAIAAMVEGPAFKKEVPEINEFVRVKRESLTIKNNGEIFNENIVWADENFFRVFSFPIISGDPKSILTDLHSLVLTEETALKFFNTTDALGRSLDIKVDGDFETFIVSGITSKPPLNSTIKFDILLSFNYLEEIHPDNGWHWVSFPTYFTINPHSNIKTISIKMEKVYRTQATSEIDEMIQMGYGNTTSWGLQPFSNMHLNTDFKGTPESSDPIYSYILSGIACFILLIACINFINLAVAQSLKRSKEIGIRKVMGGQRNQLIRQFLCESFLLCLIAFLLAIVMAEIALPLFNELSNKQLNLLYLLDLKLVIGFTSLFFFTGFAAGVYPAIVLSGFNPAKSLYNRMKYMGKNYLAKSLVVVQFALATFLIIATLFIYQQFEYMTKKNLGYNDRNLIELTIDKAIMDNDLMRTLKTEFSRIPGVEMVAPRNVGRFQGPTQAAGKEFQAIYEHVDEDFTPTLEIPVVTGRNFSKEYPSDPVNSVLVNEAFVREAGWGDPIGKTVDHMNIPGWGEKKMTIVGVVKDHHFESLKEKIKPEIFTYDPRLPLGKFLIRIKSDHIPETLKSMERLFLKMFPYDSFQYSFKNEMNQNNYKAENQWRQIISIAAVLAIFISCIGLFGLTALNAERRTKEIGIRKVLGASITQIIGLISKDFIKLIIISFVIVLPVVWYSIDRWLRNFAYSIEIRLWVFVFAGMLALLIALLTISIQALRAAMANPIKSLRIE